MLKNYTKEVFFSLRLHNHGNGRFINRHIGAGKRISFNDTGISSNSIFLGITEIPIEDVLLCPKAISSIVSARKRVRINNVKEIKINYIVNLYEGLKSEDILLCTMWLLACAYDLKLDLNEILFSYHLDNNFMIIEHDTRSRFTYSLFDTILSEL